MESLVNSLDFDNVYDGKTVLVTGDTGFKGSWLAIWLQMFGANVIGYSLPPKTDKDNYIVSGLSKKITHIDGDIRDYDTLVNIFSRYKPEIAFHLAAQAIVLDSYKDPLYTFGTNIMGAVNFFEAVRNTSSVKVAVNVTSDKCYENREQVYSYKENDPMGGNDPYSASKGASEIITTSYLNSFFREEGTANIASARAGNVIGGGDWSPYRIFPDCVRALFENKPIVIRNPESIRPWQHVFEPLDGYLKLASSLYREGKKYSGAWNFGPLSKDIFSVKSLVEETISQWGKGEYVIDNKRCGSHEACLLYLDISKAVNHLKWRPVLSFKQAIKFSIDEYKVDGLSNEQVFNQRVNDIKRYIKLKQSL